MAEIGIALALGLVLAWIAWIDARSLRIPDVLTLPLIAAGLALAGTRGGPGVDAAVDHLAGAALGFASLGLIGHLYHRRTGQEALGLGDAKLFAAAGAWLGWQALPQVLLIAALSGLSFALLRRHGTGQPLAFGPWLALGFWLGWVTGIGVSE